MFCRRVWQRVGPLAQRLFSPTSRNIAPVRHMAFGVPGGSTNLTYFVLCGGGLTAAVVYAYKTVSGDTERYEDRLANMNFQAKVKEAPETATPAAEPAAAEEEPAPEAEIITESVPAEPVTEISAEPVDEAASEEAAVEASEMVVTEASAEPEEEAAPAVVEESAEAAFEVTAEAAESPDLQTAVKILGSSAVEIAAASVGEENLVTTVHLKENNEKLIISTEEKSEALESAPEMDTKEAAAAASMEGRSVEAEEDKLNPATEEVTIEESPAPAAAQEEEGSSLPEESSSVEEAEAAQEEAVSSTDTLYQDASPSEEVEKVTVTAERPPEEETPAGEASTEETPGAAEATQLAAASVLSSAEPVSPSPGAPALEPECCHSCHSFPSAGEEVAPPAAVGEDLLTKEEVDPKHEAKEESSLLEEQNTENMVVLTAICDQCLQNSPNLDER